jgi:hypothetical protein
MLLILSILPSLRRGRCAVQSRISPPLLPAKYSPISSKGGRPGSDMSTCWTFARRARRIRFFSGCTRVSQKQTSAPIKTSTSCRCLVLMPSKSFFKVEISTSFTLACNCKYGKTSPSRSTEITLAPYLFAQYMPSNPQPQPTSITRMLSGNPRRCR